MKNNTQLPEFIIQAQNLFCNNLECKPHSLTSIFGGYATCKEVVVGDGEAYCEVSLSIIDQGTLSLSKASSRSLDVKFVPTNNGVATSDLNFDVALRDQIRTLVNIQNLLENKKNAIGMLNELNKERSDYYASRIKIQTQNMESYNHKLIASKEEASDLIDKFLSKICNVDDSPAHVDPLKDDKLEVWEIISNGDLLKHTITFCADELFINGDIEDKQQAIITIMNTYYLDSFNK